MSQSAKLLTAGGFLSFFVFGFIDNLKGPILPELLAAQQLSYSQGGTLVLGGYLGFIIATLLTGIMSDMVSNRGVLLLAGLLLCVGLFGFGWTSSYALLVVSMSVIGLGLGAIEVGGNGLMVELHSHELGRYLNLLATCHGVGSLLVPLYVAGLITAGVDWQPICLSLLVLPALWLLVLWSAGRAPERAVVVSGWDWNAVYRLGFTRQMLWFYVLLGSYVAVELGLAAWLVEYLQRERGYSVTTSSLMLSAFFLLLMLGRLIGSVLVERVGYFPMICGGLLGSLVCLVVGLFGPTNCLWLLSLSGLFMSIVFPTVTAAVSRLHQANIGSILGILFTFGGLGGALGPWTVGLVSDAYGLQIGLATLFAYALIALIALGILSAHANPRGGG